MPPDVFIVLASSGLTLVASLMFLVSDAGPVEPPHDPRNDVAFCLPPLRRAVRPPPLPVQPECSLSVSTDSLCGVLTLRPSGDDWLVTLETLPVCDTPALQVHAQGRVHDLRWHGRAGVERGTRRTWRQKPGQA